MSVAAAEPKAKKAHRGWVWTLVVLATLITLISSLTIFVKREALDSKAWSNASAKLLQDKQIRDALSVYMVNQLYANVDVKAQLQDLLPKQIKSLAGPASALVRQFAPQAASDLLARPDVQRLWQDLNYRAHQQVMEIINGKKNGIVQTQQGGDVILDVHPLIQQLADRLGFGSSLSPEAGRIVILRSNQLKLAQDAVKLIKVLNVFLVLLALALYAVAVWLARGWRREVLRATGWSLVIVGVLLLVVRNYAGNMVVDSLVKTESIKPAARDVWLIASTLLADVAWAIIMYGVAVVIAAWLGGPTRWATGLRRWLAPAFSERMGMVSAVVAFLFLLLLLWAPTRGLQMWWSILLFAALIAGGVYALRNETLQEFPDAGGGTQWPDVRGGWNKLRGGTKDGGSEPPPAPPAAE